MLEDKSELREIHWLMDMLQTLEVGVMVVDDAYRLNLWNSFMQNHSNLRPKAVIGKPVWEVFPEIPKDWFQRKVDSVLTLHAPAFTTWEQRPYLLRFQSYRPVTGAAECMYQNTTFMPLLSADGAVKHVGIVIHDVTEVAVNRMDLQAANAKLEVVSRTDRLTKLFNRGYWEERLNEEFRRSRRTDSPASLILFDIDHFKRVNDNYGHPAGDQVLRRVAEVVRYTARATDIAGRYGGEEFGLLLIETSERGALMMAERLRRMVSAESIETDAGAISVTISLGVSELGAVVDNTKAWIECADQALYAAKRGGRDQVVLYRPEI